MDAEARARWLGERFPDGIPPQWWNAVLGLVETEVGPLRGLPRAESAEQLAFAAVLLAQAPALGGISRCEAAARRVRLAAIACRYRPPLEGLPPELTPDGSARRLLDALPLSRPQARAAARLRRHRLDSGEDRYHVPGEPITPGRGAPGTLTPLQETERAVGDLRWVVDAIEDPEVRAEAAAWLAQHD
ncbi:hypothetical protein D7319_03560 [Streptomyces radicis]|uniref:Uncharacterized protein n=1 Tax=Streptomyces radicis TaxID=1750517 RepID=A0A3A9WR52_9ACTN|nr:hypothetical protein D7319_03560 [Streptomyces radicis]RKN25955.1 hypothetical protein D7318_06920 [Streptomyces radicis]